MCRVVIRNSLFYAIVWIWSRFFEKYYLKIHLNGGVCTEAIEGYQTKGKDF